MHVYWVAPCLHFQGTYLGDNVQQHLWSEGSQRCLTAGSYRVHFHNRGNNLCVEAGAVPPRSVQSFSQSIHFYLTVASHSQGLSNALSVVTENTFQASFQSASTLKDQQTLASDWDGPHWFHYCSDKNHLLTQYAGKVL